MNVDFEERVDFARLRACRLGRARQAMEQAGLGALLVFDNNNIRYLTSVAIGEWTRDKFCRYALCRRASRASRMDAAIGMIRPGVSTGQVARLWPAAREIGLEDEKTAFGLQFGHGLGLALHERPVISRLVSLDAPREIREGMVFALETYCPATDGRSAARIEEEVVVTANGLEILTEFPAQELYVTNPY